MIDFKDLELPLAHSVLGEAPGPDVKARLMARIHAQDDTRAAQGARERRNDQPAAPPAGFAFMIDADTSWEPHPVPGSE